MARVDAVIFDKTGTLTAAGATRGEFFGQPLSAREERLVCSLTRHSTHPLSRRIHDLLRTGSPASVVASFVETPGCGIAGRIDGHEVRLGSEAWFRSCGIGAGTDGSESPAFEPAISSPRQTGSAAGGVWLAMDGRFRGSFSFDNALRPAADALLRDLGRQMDIGLLSGDNERERERFRALFGPKAKLHFNQSPLDKLGVIRRLRESGRTVMMVGDGLNDAGALRQSDVGVAVVEKMGAFSPASDVILDAARIPDLPAILRLARDATRIVKASFGISAAYNFIGLGIAATGYLSPLICAVLMPVSSVSVVLFACGATAWAVRRAGLLAAEELHPGREP